MGKGLALQFKHEYPKNFNEYVIACEQGEVKLGQMFVTQTGKSQPRLIVNFPTKGYFRDRSRLVDVQTGLKDLVKVIREENITSIAIPALGCGLGGLRWEDVRPEIEQALSSLPEITVLLFPPQPDPRGVKQR